MTSLFLSSAFLTKRTLPENLRDRDYFLFHKHMEYHAPNASIQTLDNIYASKMGYLFQGNRVLPKSFVAGSPPNKRRQRREAYKNWLMRPFAKTRKSALWITDTWSHNYFHWLTDCIPRLHTTLKLFPEAQLYLPATLKRAGFLSQTLAAYSIQTPKFVDTSMPVRFQEFLLPDHIVPTGNYNPALMKEIAARYIRHFSDDKPATRRLYISRAKAGMRHIVNEEDILPSLKEAGFEVLHCEDLGFIEQVKTFNEAEIVIAPHGAGLTNTLFMPAGSKLLEIFPRDDTINACYFSLSAALGHRYSYMFACPETRVQVPYSSNLVIDTEAFSKELARLL
ncbi:glycosyltransferase family 61 protein [Roseibium sp.]|uniref:glycosyltransferase family 61 protein n=1 Tax=Roseibium sp. TaxID=1936156 RepID=UPI003A982E33